MPCGTMEGQSVVDVGRSLVTKSFVGVSEDLELASFLDGEPVEVLEVGGVMWVLLGRSRMSLAAAFCMVWSRLKTWEEMLAGVESVAVVEAAGDQGLRDGLSGVGRDPFENSAEHTEGVEAGGSDCIDLSMHG